MKGFIAAVTLFSFMVILILFNYFFVSSVAADMEQSISQLQSDPCKENEIIIDDFEKKWNKNRIWLSLSVSYDDIKDLTDTLDALKSANETRDIGQFQIHVGLLLNCIDEIGRLEKLSIKNIL